MRIAVLIVGWAWVAVAIAVETDVSSDMDWGLGIFFSGLLVGSAWAAASFLPPAAARTRWRWEWWTLPVGVLVVVLLSTTGWGLVARVWLCESELRSYAEGVQADGNVVRPVKVGLFRVQGVEGGRAEVRLVTGNAMLDVVGLAYRLEPPGPADLHYEHLFGRWYRFCRPF